MSPRRETLTDLVTYLARVWFGGFVAAAFTGLAVLAAALDFIAGRGRATGSLGRVLDQSARFEAWLDVHGTRTRITVVPEAGHGPEVYADRTSRAEAERPSAVATRTT